jgi:hypothetical protein
MSASSNRFWPVAWLILAIVVIPFGLAYALFDVNQFEIGVLFALLGLLMWLIGQGAGWRPVDKDTVVILKDSLDGLTAHPKRSYLFIPIIHKVEAVLPTFPITFEFPVEKIDTHTLGLNKIDRITVRATCQITNPEMFYRKSRIYIDLIRQIEEAEKLRPTDIRLWRTFLKQVANVYLDDTLRDVVWKWKSTYLTDPEVVRSLDHAPEKDGKPNLDGDPYSLSRNRKSLAEQVKLAVRNRLEQDLMGFRINPLVFESIELDGEQIKRATGDRTKEIEKASHEAAVVAAGMLARGEAEATVRAVTLAKLLHVLIEDHKIPRTDPIIAEVVRAALYSDGEMIWKGVLEKSADGNGKVKTA